MQETQKLKNPSTRVGKAMGFALKTFAVAITGSALLIAFPMNATGQTIPEPEAYAQALTMHHHYSALNMVQDHLISGSGKASRGFFGQTPCDPCGVNPCDDVACGPCDPICGSGGLRGLFGGRNGGRNAWVSYVGRSDAYALGDTTTYTEKYRLSSEGIQMGADLFLSRKSQFGVLFGYEDTRLRNGSEMLAMDDVYFGFYGVRVFRGGADARVIFAYGHQEYDVLTDGEKVPGVFFKGYTTETNLELGKRFNRGALSFRPVVALDVFNNNLKGIEGVVSKASLTQAFFRMGSDLRLQVKKTTFNSGIYYAYDVNKQDLSATLDDDTPITAAKPGRELWTFNLGADYQVSKNFSIFGGYRGEYVADRSSETVHSVGFAGGGFKW